MTRDRGRPVAHVDELIQIRDLSTEKRPSTISGMLVFPPGVSSSKPVKRATPPDVNSVKSPDAIWATVDLLTGEILPEGVVIENRFVNNGLIEVSGYADDNGTVAEYLRAIHAKGGRPDLHSVKPEKRDQRSVSEFSITIDPGTV
ncbi:MAG: PilN domain-containing protein [Gammaproteobacteria bacterium]|nr:PilN domain-containing protein [Gammaproteobacteria bacterium]